MVLRGILKGLLLVCLLWPLCFSALAADEASSVTAEQKSEQKPAVPSLGELGARSLEQADFVSNVKARLAELAASTDASAVDAVKDQLARLTAEMALLGPSDSWYVDRLNSYVGQFRQLRQGLEDVQKKLAGEQQEVEQIRAQIDSSQTFWQDWGGDLASLGVSIPRETLTQIRHELGPLRVSLYKATEQLLARQEMISSLQMTILAHHDELMKSLTKLRQATFRKNAYSFFSPAYYQQFNAQLIEQGAGGIRAALRVDSEYLRSNSTRFGLMALVFMAVSLFLFRQKSRLDEAPQWRFIVDHPFAAAGFGVAVGFWFFLPATPPLIHFSLLLISSVCAVVLGVTLLSNRRQAWLLAGTAVVVLVTSACRLIALPQPLFRLYIVLMALVLLPVLVYQLRSKDSADGHLFKLFLRLMALVLGVSLLAQLGGYINFSMWLIQAAFETALVLLFSRMAILLFSGAIDLLIALFSRSEKGFFYRYGDDLSTRLQRLLIFVVCASALFYLLPLWRLTTSMNDAWQGFTHLSLSIGTFELSVGMLLSALFAFYLALQLSWIVQGISDTRLLQPRRIDSGVRDSVKKLLHYSIVLIGFLLALSFLGLGLDNFIVLLGALGVGIGFGLQDIVNNFLSGLILLFERPIKAGDGVLIDGEYGIVKHIGLRSTVVENLDLAELIVPNSHMISQKVTNWTLSNRRVRIVLQVGAAYGSDTAVVLQVLMQVARQHPLVLQHPEPFPLFNNFGASSLDFELRVWIADIDQRPKVKSDLLLAIDQRFREEGIEIPFSQHDLHLRSVDPAFLSLANLPSADSVPPD